jgi:hypothetical protein
VKISKYSHPKHGYYGTTIYRVWIRMRQRCNNPNDRNYRWYGARGITVCERWSDFGSFIADMGVRPKGMTLERIDNNKGYNPDNCRWATMQEQGRNRRDNRNYTLNGVTQNISAWARQIGISHETMRQRLSKWPTEKALSEPVSLRYSNAR